MGSAQLLLIVATVVAFALPILCTLVVRAWWLRRLEARVLREKYGDLPMFKHLFR